MLKKAKTIFMLSFVIGVSENAKYGTSIIQVVVSVHVYEDVSVAVALKETNIALLVVLWRGGVIL